MPILTKYTSIGPIIRNGKGNFWIVATEHGNVIKKGKKVRIRRIGIDGLYCGHVSMMLVTKHFYHMHIKLGCVILNDSQNGAYANEIR